MLTSADVSRAVEYEEEQTPSKVSRCLSAVRVADGNGHLRFNFILNQTDVVVYKSRDYEENHLDYQFLQTGFLATLKRKGEVFCHWKIIQCFHLVKTNEAI